MQKFLKKLLFLLACTISFCATAQNLISPITINLPANPPANTAEWAATLPPVMILAQTKMVNGQVNGTVQESRILVTIKSGGSKVCGTYTPQNAPMSNFNSANKNWIGANILTLLGQECILKPGNYELCVQFYALSPAQGGLLGESCKPFTIADKKDKTVYSPPTNVSPINEKVFTEKELNAPLTFRWTPVIPRPKDPVVYRLRVWQLMQGQSGAQAMKSNTPLFEKEVTNITQSVDKITFPPCSYNGSCGNKFTWNVEASKKNAMGEVEMLGVSEPSFFDATKGANEAIQISNIYPADNAIITEKEMGELTTFKWTPMIPKPRNPVVYRLRIWEAINGQEASQTMKLNKPYVVKDIKEVTEISGMLICMIGRKPPCFKNNKIWDVEALILNDKGEEVSLGRSEPSTIILEKAKEDLGVNKKPISKVKNVPPNSIALKIILANKEVKGHCVSAKDGWCVEIDLRDVFNKPLINKQVLAVDQSNGESWAEALEDGKTQLRYYFNENKLSAKQYDKMVLQKILSFETTTTTPKALVATAYKNARLKNVPAKLDIPVGDYPITIVGTPSKEKNPSMDIRIIRKKDGTFDSLKTIITFGE
jgi:hypothetical protein